VSSGEISPFSPLQNYKLKAYPFTPNPPGHLNDWEKHVLEFLSATKAATYFQLCDHTRQKKKLNAMSRAGLVHKYQLQGQRNINIVSSVGFDNLDKLLRTLVFTQLVLKLKPRDILPGSNHIHAHIVLNNVFPVIVLRHGDDPGLVPFITNRLDRVIIISEVFYSEFNKIKTPCRICLDQHLMQSGLSFYLPDKRTEIFS
jgi:hypothetical protein